jgi:hypothetical protein
VVLSKRRRDSQGNKRKMKMSSMRKTVRRRKRKKKWKNQMKMKVDHHKTIMRVTSSMMGKQKTRKKLLRMKVN